MSFIFSIYRYFRCSNTNKKVVMWASVTTTHFPCSFLFFLCNWTFAAHRKGTISIANLEKTNGTSRLKGRETATITDLRHRISTAPSHS